MTCSSVTGWFRTTVGCRTVPVRCAVIDRCRVPLGGLRGFGRYPAYPPVSVGRMFHLPMSRKLDPAVRRVKGCRERSQEPTRSCPRPATTLRGARSYPRRRRPALLQRGHPRGQFRAGRVRRPGHPGDLYRHFPSKDHLIAAYLAGRLERDQEQLARLRRDHPAIAPPWSASVTSRRGRRTRQGFRGCPYANLTAEYCDVDHPRRTSPASTGSWLLHEVEQLSTTRRGRATSWPSSLVMLELGRWPSPPFEHGTRGSVHGRLVHPDRPTDLRILCPATRVCSG